MKHLGPEEIFSNFAKMDFVYGPAFQNLIGSDVAGKRSVTDFCLAPSSLEDVYGGDYILHPTTLDSVFQSCFGCLAADAQETAVFLPRRIGRLFVPSNLGKHQGHMLESFMELVRLSKRDATFQGLVVPVAKNGSDEGKVAFTDHNESDRCLR